MEIVDPRTMKPVYVPKNPHEKAMQRALIQYRNPKNYDLVMEALRTEGRMDLVGFEKHCLIRPRQMKNNGYRPPQDKQNSKKKATAKPAAKKKAIRNVHKKKSK